VRPQVALAELTQRLGLGSRAWSPGALNSRDETRLTSQVEQGGAAVRLCASEPFRKVRTCFGSDCLDERVSDGRL
jgi:hypothetical protein